MPDVVLNAQRPASSPLLGGEGEAGATKREAALLTQALARRTATGSEKELPVATEAGNTYCLFGVAFFYYFHFYA